MTMSIMRAAQTDNFVYMLGETSDGYFIMEYGAQANRALPTKLSFAQKLLGRHDTVFCDRIKNHLDNAQRNGNELLAVEKARLA